MRIKTFKLLGHKIKVSYVKRIMLPDGSTPYGVYYSEQNKIVVATHSPNNNEPLPEEFIRHTFFHELSHAMMLLMNRHELYQDECFVDNLGGLLAQFYDTHK